MLPVLSDKNHCNTKESESLNPEVFSSLLQLRATRRVQWGTYGTSI